MAQVGRAGDRSNVSRTAVITGGTGGLGSALVRRLLRRDLRLVVTYLLPEEADRFESEFEVDDQRLTIRRVDAGNRESDGTQRMSKAQRKALRRQSREQSDDWN